MFNPHYLNICIYWRYIPFYISSVWYLSHLYPGILGMPRRMSGPSRHSCTRGKVLPRPHRGLLAARPPALGCIGKLCQEPEEGQGHFSASEAPVDSQGFLWPGPGPCWIVLPQAASGAPRLSPRPARSFFRAPTLLATAGPSRAEKQSCSHSGFWCSLPTHPQPGRWAANGLLGPRYAGGPGPSPLVHPRASCGGSQPDCGNHKPRGCIIFHGWVLGAMGPAGRAANGP